MRGRRAWTAILLLLRPEAAHAQSTGSYRDLLEQFALPAVPFILDVMGVALAAMALRRVSALQQAIIERLGDLGEARVRPPGITGGAPIPLQDVLSQLSRGQREAQGELDARLRALTRQVDGFTRSSGSGGGAAGGLLRRPTADFQPEPAETPEAERERLLERYRQAVLDLSGAGESFLADFSVSGASPAGDGDFLAGEDARAAFIWSARLSDGSRALLPGSRPS